MGKILSALLAICLAGACCCPVSQAEEPAAEPEIEAETSPKPAWGEIDAAAIDHGQHSPWRSVLLWLPNRIMDFIDIFRVDVGVGPAVGAVIRVSKYGQAGYRNMLPASVRVGDFGRDTPVKVERSNEFGVGPAYVASKDRKICLGEVGAGADLLIAGVYAGICVDELADFAAGLFFIDLKDDDY